MWDGRRFLGVEVPLLLQFSIAVFTGMVAATLVPPVRKSIPRPVEMGLWIALVIVCVVAVVSITNPVVRELTSAAFWGVDQVINTSVGLIGAGIVWWISEHRFPIATWVVLAVGVDILALAMLRSYRTSKGWQPIVRLGEWMELPRLAAPATAPVVVPYAIDELNRKWAAATAVAGAAILTWLISFSIWARDVVLPRQAERLAHAAAVGRIESRARLESFRDTASQLQFAARAWYAAAGEPALNGLAVKAADSVRAAKARQRAAQPAPERVVDIHVLLSAQSIGWYGPMRPAPAVPAEEEEEDASGHAGRLAS
ncbi:MAG: hypothetical protein NVS9B11_00430 [Candidatus Dormibacteraceae bacterium]